MEGDYPPYEDEIVLISKKSLPDLGGAICFRDASGNIQPPPDRPNLGQPVPPNSPTSLGVWQNALPGPSCIGDVDSQKELWLVYQAILNLMDTWQDDCRPMDILTKEMFYCAHRTMRSGPQRGYSQYLSSSLKKGPTHVHRRGNKIHFLSDRQLTPIRPSWEHFDRRRSRGD